MGNSACGGPELSLFQKKKLLHEFHTFLDFSRNGRLEWKDFDLARQKICQMSGWSEEHENYMKSQRLFLLIWETLRKDADKDSDGTISAEEWLQMWQKVLRVKPKESEKDRGYLPVWIEKYIEFRFNLYDRTGENPRFRLKGPTPWREHIAGIGPQSLEIIDLFLYLLFGDGVVDIEEFEYVLSDFGVPSKNARSAFIIFSQNQQKIVDLEYFKKLSAEYFKSDDPSSLGNFITGKLDFA